MSYSQIIPSAKIANMAKGIWVIKPENIINGRATSDKDGFKFQFKGVEFSFSSIIFSG